MSETPQRPLSDDDMMRSVTSSSGESSGRVGDADTTDTTDADTMDADTTDGTDADATDAADGRDDDAIDADADATDTRT